MKKTNKNLNITLIFLIVIIINIGLVNAADWYKGTLHQHSGFSTMYGYDKNSSTSDDQCPGKPHPLAAPIEGHNIGNTTSEIVEKAKTFNHSFIAISDHSYCLREENFNVTKQDCDNNTDGVYIGGVSGAKADNNMIDSNNITNSGRHGINIVGYSENNTIINNMIKNSTQYGIYIGSPSADLQNITNNTILDNKVGVYVTSNNNSINYNNISYNIDASAFDSGADNDWNKNDWHDILSLDVIDSDNDGFGDSGTQYPYNATFGNVSGNVVDFMPIIPRTRPIISSIRTNPIEPRINDSINCEANITDPNNDPIIWANFTIYYPNGTKALNNVNGTQNNNIWTSSNVTAYINGIWNCSITASDNKSRVSTNSITFPVIEPKSIISTTIGATPFYTISPNPQICPNLKKGSTCNVTWQINATGTIGGRWEFYSIYNVINYSVYIANNESERVNVTII